MRQLPTSYVQKNEKPRYLNRSMKRSRSYSPPSAVTLPPSPRSRLIMSDAPKNRPPKTLLLLLICAALGSGCASKSPIVMTQPCPQLQPPPAPLLEPEQPNLTQRLRREFGLSQPTDSGQ